MRTKNGAAKTQKRRRLMRRAEGFVGGRRKLIRTVKETLVHSGVYAFRDRRVRKRQFRRLWIIRLNAAVRERGLRYSQFAAGLKSAKIELDRKMLSEMAIHDPAGFDVVFAQVKKVIAA